MSKMAPSHRKAGVTAGVGSAEWFRFVSAPGTAAIRVAARGKVEAWIDGEPMRDAGKGRFVAGRPPSASAVVALRIVPETGRGGGAALPEPVVVETDASGVIALGDWSKLGILNNYSGGARYGAKIVLTKEEARVTDAVIDLGKVAGTAEVRVNGRDAGVRVAPPWRLAVTGLLKTGENLVEVTVYNTLANHYQTIPSKYRGSPASGLLGPVRLLSRDWEPVAEGK